MSPRSGPTSGRPGSASAAPRSADRGPARLCRGRSEWFGVPGRASGRRGPPGAAPARRAGAGVLLAGSPRVTVSPWLPGCSSLLSWAGQFFAQIITERNEAEQHGQSFEWAELIPQFLVSTLENWQSEFLQLIWQAVGLALLLFWGSSQSKESDERIEAKLDCLLEDRGIDPDDVTRKVNESL
jgi:hypothetical protein